MFGRSKPKHTPTVLLHAVEGLEGFTVARLTKYEQFMKLAASAPLNQPMVPTKAIDEVWHAHQELPTYERDIIALTGRKIKHVPEKSGQPNLTQFINTARAFEEMHGAPLVSNDEKCEIAGCGAGTCAHGVPGC